MQVAERQVEQFLIQVVQSQPVRDRRIDLDGLGGDPRLLVGGDRVERAHVVQPVRELDQDDAQVLRHREQHLAEVLGLRRFARREFELVELRNAVDQVGHGRAEAILDLRFRDRGVLHHVMQQRGG